MKIFLMQVLMIEQGNKCAITASSDTRDTHGPSPPLLGAIITTEDFLVVELTAYTTSIFIHVYLRIFVPGQAQLTQLLLTQVTTTSRVQ